MHLVPGGVLSPRGVWSRGGVSDPGVSDLGVGCLIQGGVVLGGVSGPRGVSASVHTGITPPDQTPPL